MNPSTARVREFREREKQLLREGWAHPNIWLEPEVAALMRAACSERQMTPAALFAALLQAGP